MFVPQHTSRTASVNWVTCVQDALDIAGQPVPLSTLNTLTTMNTCAAAAPSAYVDTIISTASNVPSLGGGDGISRAAEYCRLLVALDTAVTAWPTEMRQLLHIPPRAKGNQLLAGVPATLVVSTPAAEAVHVLHNAAVAIMKTGLEDFALSKMHEMDRAGAAVKVVGGRPVVTTSNLSARTAAKRFQACTELTAWASAVADDRAAAPTRAAGHDVDLPTTATLARVLSAVAKYVYSVSSEALSHKPDLLGRLAFHAASLSLPPSVTSHSTLRWLPIVLLAAYHRHRAEHYYAGVDPKMPDMANALAHARYALQLLSEVVTQWDAKRTLGSNGSGTTKSSITNFFTGLLGVGGKKNATVDDSFFGNDPARAAEEDEEEGIAEARRTLSKLARLVDDTDDLVRAYPLFHPLLREVFSLLAKYTRENRIVYLSRPASAAAVRVDVPTQDELAVVSGGSAAAATVTLPRFLLQDAAGAKERQGDCAIFFRDMPAPSTLAAAMSKHERKASLLKTSLRNIDAMRRVVAEIESFTLPENISVAVRAVAPLISHGSITDTLHITRGAVDRACTAHESAAEQWLETKQSYIGALCAAHPASTSALQQAREWWEQMAAAETLWNQHVRPALEAAAANGSLDNSADEETQLWAALAPQAVQATGYAAGAQQVCETAAEHVVQFQGKPLVDGEDDERREEDDIRLTMELVGSAAHEAQTLLASAKPLKDPRYWDDVVVAMEAVREAVRVAPQLVEMVDETTSVLEEECKRVVVTPLERREMVTLRMEPDTESAEGDSTEWHEAREPENETEEEEEQQAVTTTTSSKKKPTPKKRSPTPKKNSSAKSPRASLKRARSETPPSEVFAECHSGADEEKDEDEDDSAEEAPRKRARADGSSAVITKAKVSGSLLSAIKANKTAALKPPSRSNTPTGKRAASKKPAAKPAQSRSKTPAMKESTAKKPAAKKPAAKRAAKK